MVQSIRKSHSIDKGISESKKLNPNVQKLMNMGKKEDNIKQKKNFLNAFAKNPKSTQANVIEEKSEKTKHDSYTYDLDEVLKNSDIISAIKSEKDKNTREKEKENLSRHNSNPKLDPKLDHRFSVPAEGKIEGKIEGKNKSAEEILSAHKNKSMENLNEKEFNPHLSDNNINLKKDLLTRKIRNNLEGFVNSHLSYNSKVGNNLTLYKNIDDDTGVYDENIFPAFRHNNNRSIYKPKTNKEKDSATEIFKK